MSSGEISAKRNQTLILVEGKHEKDVFLKLFIRCFPELNIQYENIYVYNTNIYDLYDAIVKEYNNPEWYKDEEEIDLPLLISNREGISPKLDKRNFSNIFLIFDYERQDAKFSWEKISRLQRHFCSATDDGLLFINYPMVEAYKDMPIIPDNGYYGKKYYEILTNGGNYKKTVHQTSALEQNVSQYNKVVKYFEDYKMTTVMSENPADKIFSLDVDCHLETNICKILVDEVNFDNDCLDNAKYYLCSVLRRNVKCNMTYWGILRELLLIIAKQNISKGYMIQEQQQVPQQLSSELYYQIDYSKILAEQNKCSHIKDKGFVWVLSTCMCVLGDYKFFWKKE